jgi:hypothetical protein
MTATEASSVPLRDRQRSKNRGISPAWMPLAALVLTMVIALSRDIVPDVPATAVSGIGGTIASVGSTMLGFLLAALAVIASINHTHLIKMMRTTGHYNDLLKTIFVGCLIFICVVFSGGIWLFASKPPPDWSIAMILGLHAGAFVSLLDIGRKFWLVLRNLQD